MPLPIYLSFMILDNGTQAL